jgi:hypothetical protein
MEIKCPLPECAKSLQVKRRQPGTTFPSLFTGVQAFLSPTSCRIPPGLGTRTTLNRNKDRE